MEIIRRLETLEVALLSGPNDYMRTALREALIASYGRYEDELNAQQFRKAEVLFSELGNFYEGHIGRDNAHLALVVVRKLKEVINNGEEKVHGRGRVC